MKDERGLYLGSFIVYYSFANCFDIIIGDLKGFGLLSWYHLIVIFICYF